MLATVAARIAREGMFRDGGTVGVAVSGGADSVALLHALRELLAGRDLVVAHVNHGLRGAASDADEAFVRELAERLGCRCVGRRLDLESGSGNLEEAARRGRHRFFGELLSSGACSWVATGHTRSDQAETVLFRLLRGAAGAGLSGIWPVLDGRIARPLLDVPRAGVLEFLRDRGIAWREDASNADPAFARNRLRHDLLPRIRSEWNPGAESALASTADWALEEERYWRGRTAELLQRCVRDGPEGPALEVGAVRSLHPAEQRRLLAAVLKLPALGSGSAGFGHIESLRALVLGPAGTGGVDLPGARAERSFDTVVLRRSPVAEPSAFDVELPVPGRVELPGQAPAVLRTRLVGPRGYNANGPALLDWDRVGGSLRLRNWRPGDRFRPVGRDSAKKIKDLFQRSQVRAWMRAGWPVVTAPDGGGAERIVWSRGFGPAADLAARPDSRRLLAVQESCESSAARVSQTPPPAS